MKKIFLIVLGAAALLFAAYHAFNYLRLKPGRDCFDYFVELEKTDDLKLVDMFDDKSVVTVTFVHPDRTMRRSQFVGEQFRTNYHAYLTSEQAKQESDEYWDIKVDKKDGNFVITATDYHVQDNTEGPFTITFDGARTDRCMVVESHVIIYVKKPEPTNAPPDAPPSEPEADPALETQ